GQERDQPRRRGDQHEPLRADPQSPEDAHAARREGAQNALRYRRKERSHARRSRPGLRGDARAHPSDRGQGAAQAAPPEPFEAAEELHRKLRRVSRRWLLVALGTLATGTSLGCDAHDSIRSTGTNGVLDAGRDATSDAARDTGVDAREAGPRP